jgi:crotonobetainyl-CoA:carnitine CoA-transferase CaiB-like acyl-CoA transferase
MTDATLCERMIGGKHPLHGALPNYDVYPAKNGTFIAVGCLEPALWSRFAKLLQVKPDRQSVAAKLLEKTADEWESICAKAKLPVDKVRSPAEAVRDHPEMFASLGMTTNVTIDGKEYSLPVPPVRSPADTEEPLMKIRSRM